MRGVKLFPMELDKRSGNGDNGLFYVFQQGRGEYPE